MDLDQSDETRNKVSCHSSILNGASNCPSNELGECETDNLSTRSSRREKQTDEDPLSRTISECGIDAYGCIFIEIWVLSPDGQRLIRPSGGHWIDPIFLHCSEKLSLVRKLNEHAADHAIGEGLVGTLFEETFRWRHSSNGSSRRRVHWRQIQSLSNDPYYTQPSAEKRMEMLNSLGIGIVGTLPFHLQGERGIVMFMSRSTVDIDKLRSEANERYLVCAADMIAAAYAIRMPRKECSNIRKEMVRSATRKVRHCIFQMGDRGENFASFVKRITENGELEKHQTSSNGIGINEQMFDQQKKSSCFGLPEMFEYWRTRTTNHLEHSFHKWRGAGLHGPPRQPISDCVNVFAGVLLVLVVLLRLNEALHDDDVWDTIAYDGAWFAGPLCMIFAMTPAPVGQPRQIFCAHIWCTLVGLAFKQVPQAEHLDEDHHLYDESRANEIKTVPLHWVQSMSTAFAISSLAYFGIMHPPAAALSFKFSNKANNWQIGNLAGILIADIIMVFMSMVILNLQPLKQYPMFWLGFRWKPLVSEKTSQQSSRRKSSLEFKNFHRKYSPHENGNSEALRVSSEV